jgi:transposase
MYHPHHYYFKAKPLQEVNRYDLWRGAAKIKKLSTKACLRLEWIIFYETIAGKNATLTCKHFGISRSLFYFWFSRFVETRLETLEDKPPAPHKRRSWNPPPNTLTKMIKLRKRYIHWSKIKLAVVYENLYGEKISSWQFQRVIREFKLYPPRKTKIGCKTNGAKKQLISWEVRQTAKNLYSIDTKVLHLFGKKHYVIVAVGHDQKLAYARAYTTHSSAATADFLSRLINLLDTKPEIILTDNGSEFAKHFGCTCQKQGIRRYFSRPRTPKDNPEVERIIKTLIYEWLNDGHWSPKLQQFNKYITEWLIIYNAIRPHEKLNYLTPLQYAIKTGVLSKRLSSSTIN